MSPATIISRLRNAHPDHHAIAQGMAVGAVFVFLSKVAGAAKEMAIAWRYGISDVVDAYIFILNLVSWPVTVWFGVLAVVLIPVAAVVRERRADELSRFRAELLGLAAVTGSLLWLLSAAGLPLALQSSISGLPAGAVQQAIAIAPALSSLLFFGMVISVLSTWMMSGRQHTNTLLEGVPAFTILSAVVLAPAAGPQTLVWGTVGGFALHLGSLAVSLARRRELDLPRFTMRSPHWKPFWQGFGIMLAGQALMSLTNIVDQFFAARLGTGAISTLSYANRIIALVVALGATAISRATLPVFSRAEAQGSTHTARMARHWTILLLLAGCAALIAGWWMAPWGVATLFERGAFTPADTRAVAEVLRYGLFQLPVFLPSLVLVSAASSRQFYGVLFMSGVIGLLTKLIGNVMLAPLAGLNGLMLANALMYAATCGFLILMIRPQTPNPATN